MLPKRGDASEGDYVGTPAGNGATDLSVSQLLAMYASEEEDEVVAPPSSTPGRADEICTRRFMLSGFCSLN